ncbi:MAG: recombinase family protein [Candidatus Riflebacteria bacterium]|nr:recombinase family protein [Candidatus Riflebacteria bacterium]
MTKVKDIAALLANLIIAVYVRCSTLDQELASQDLAVEEWLHKHNLKATFRFADEGKSGVDIAGRKSFQQLMADARAKKYQALITWDLSRLARNHEDLLELFKVLRTNGILVYSIKDDILYPDEDSIFMVLFRAFEASQYSVRLSKDTRRGLYGNVKSGKSTGGRIYGFTTCLDKKLIVNELEAVVIRQVFKMYLYEEKGFKQIADELNASGYRNSRGNRFNKNNIYNILNNEMLTGCMVYGKTTNRDSFGNKVRNLKVPKEEVLVIPDVIPAIISKDDFEQAQKKLAENKAKPASFKKKRLYLLSGILFCGECGRPLSGSSRTGGRNKSEYVSYICPNKKAGCCSVKELPAIRLEKAVVKSLLPIIFENKYKKLSKYFNETALQESAIKMERDGLLHSLKQCRKQKDNFINSIGAGINPDIISQKIQEAEKAIQTLEERIRQIDESQQIDKKFLKKIVKKLIKLKDQRVVKYLKPFIKEFVSKITVNNEKIVIEAARLKVGRKSRKKFNVKN